MLISALLLLSLGITVIYSSSQSLAYLQIAYAFIGMVFYFLLRSFDYRSLSPLIRYSYILIIVLLLITFVLGFETRGSVRWIPIGPFNFQPSEFAKPVIILVLAQFWLKNMPTWKNIFKSFLIILPVIGLIFEQPDLGTALTIVFIWLVMLLGSHISLFKTAILGLASLITVPSAWFFLHDYQKQRVISFLSPAHDPQGIGFQVIQSTIAVGSGQLLGRGLGRGTQSRLQFLPEFRTDFIFAFIAEELGFLGSMLIIVFYSLIFYFSFKALSKVGDRFGEMIIIGVIAMLLFQIIVNIGMNIGLLPITGITLPLLSYGGSSVITVLMCLGFVASVSKFGMKMKEVSSVDTLI